MQAGPPPENPDPAPTVWERLDEDDSEVDPVPG